MKKPSLAVDLAKQAAAAAMAEVQETETKASFQASRWQPAALPQGFALAPALQQAVQQVAGHLGQWLQHEGLAVSMATAGGSATGPQPLPTKEAAPTAVRVQEQGNGRLVRGYTESAVLGLFASQQQRNGVVVDGQV
jgi:hypothetical protein